MEAMGLAALAMQFLSSAASGAGSSIAMEVSRVVRDRLNGTTEGSAAISRLDSEPDNTENNQAVQRLIADQAREDPTFSEQLGRLVNAAQQSPAASQVTQINHGSAAKGGSLINFLVQGGMSGGTIRIGSMRASATPGLRAVLLVAVVGLIILLVLGIYGMAQLAGGIPDAKNAPTPQSMQDSSHEPVDDSGLDAKLASKERLKRALLGKRDMPEGWVEDAPKQVVNEEKPILSQAWVAYRSPDRGDLVTVNIWPMWDAASAVKYLAELKELFGNRVGSPEVGVESSAMEKHWDGGFGYSVLFRSDSVVVLVAFQGEGSREVYEKASFAVSRAVLKRINEARISANPTTGISSLPVD
ncbi:hypothetical protein ACFC0N_06165 [Streptomyces zaomyceticus]|uniref:hypothetical protein n=1 Tax=Streptomyces zaomyceticus TaxID=68286 RepID=UPI0035D5709C